MSTEATSQREIKALTNEGIIKLRINSNINCVLISVFFYLFKNKTIGDKSEIEAL
jgi:hypothetical protein